MLIFFFNFCYLIVLNGLRQRLHLHSLVQLVFMQQVNKIIQRALVEAHFRMQGAHTLKNFHATGLQSPERAIRDKLFIRRLGFQLNSHICEWPHVISAWIKELAKLKCLLFVFVQSGLQEAEGIHQA